MSATLELGQRIDIRPIQGRFGAEVVGLDPAMPLNDAAFARIEQAWFEHNFLVFRDLVMTPEQHIALTRRFGELHIMTPLEFNLPGHPEVLVIHYPHLPPLTEQQKRERPDVYHPLVRTHPRSGRTSLYIGRWAPDVEGMPPEDGFSLVWELFAHAAEPRFVYCHRWRRHDAVLWDNRCMLHCVTPFDEVRYQRLMHRTTLEGDLPV